MRFGANGAETDGVAETTYVVTRYPTVTFNAWARALCDIPFTKVVISATPVEAEKAVRAIDRSAAELKDRYGRSSKMSTDTATQSHYESLQYLMEELMNSIKTGLSFENVGVIEEGFTFPSIKAYQDYKTTGQLPVTGGGGSTTQPDGEDSDDTGSDGSFG